MKLVTIVHPFGYYTAINNASTCSLLYSRVGVCLAKGKRIHAGNGDTPPAFLSMFFLASVHVYIASLTGGRVLVLLHGLVYMPIDKQAGAGSFLVGLHVCLVVRIGSRPARFLLFSRRKLLLTYTLRMC